MRESDARRTSYLACNTASQQQRPSSQTFRCTIYSPSPPSLVFGREVEAKSTDCWGKAMKIYCIPSPSRRRANPKAHYMIVVHEKQISLGRIVGRSMLHESLAPRAYRTTWQPTYNRGSRKLRAKSYPNVVAKQGQIRDIKKLFWRESHNQLPAPLLGLAMWRRQWTFIKTISEKN